MDQLILDLSKAKALLMQGQCTGHYATDQGIPVGVSDPNASCFCLVGSIYRACGEKPMAIREHNPRAWACIKVLCSSLRRNPEEQTLINYHDDGGDSIKLIQDTINTLMGR